MDRFGQAAGAIPNGKRAETLGVHLAQAARFKARRHKGEITRGKNGTSVFFIKPYINAHRFRITLLQFFQSRFKLPLAIPRRNDLAARADDGFGGRKHKIDTFLMNKPRYEPE